jgi:Flp pilus assembly protein TadG
MFSGRAVQEPHARTGHAVIARCRKTWRRLKADRRGVASIEFAFVAPIFFVLLMGTIEAGVQYFAQTNLQESVYEAVRQIRTGQSACYTTTGTGACVPMTSDQFKTLVCNNASLLLSDCTNKLQVQVTTATAFNGVSDTSPLKNNAGNSSDPSNGTLDPAASGFSNGSACAVVLARAFYPWKVATPVLAWFLTDMKSSSSATSYDSHLVTAASTFREEPFTSGTSGC